MSLTKTGFLYFAVMFYGLSIILLGLIPINSTVDSSQITENENLNFLGTMIFNISELPLIVNFIFFGSLGSLVLFALGTTILGAIFDGGS